MASAKDSTLTVILAHVPNPDIRSGGYWTAGAKERSRSLRVPTLAAAREATQAYIARNDLGGGNWTGGDVYDGPNRIARISYNGRIWAPDGHEIQP